MKKIKKDSDIISNIRNNNLDYYINLLKNGYDINKKDNHGETILHNAFFGGYFELIELLIENRVNPNIKDKDGWTPPHWFKKCLDKDFEKSKEIFIKLLKIDFDPYIENENGYNFFNMITNDKQKFELNRIYKLYKLYGQK